MNEKSAIIREGIVFGKVADYAIGIASLENVDLEALATILRDIADNLL